MRLARQTDARFGSNWSTQLTALLLSGVATSNRERNRIRYQLVPVGMVEGIAPIAAWGKAGWGRARPASAAVRYWPPVKVPGTQCSWIKTHDSRTILLYREPYGVIRACLSSPGHTYQFCKGAGGVNGCLGPCGKKQYSGRLPASLLLLTAYESR